MTDRQSKLWEALAAFDIDGSPSAYSFCDRLAEENGWSRAFARQVIEEYRRFLFLAMEAGHPVTPCLAVDEAWHLHLCYTESYWGRLAAILPRPLHHHPTKGGLSEEAKHRRQFDQTRSSYRAFFGEPPPDAVWRWTPPAKTNLDPSRYWAIPKAAARRAAIFGGATVLGALAVAGCGPVIAQSIAGVGVLLAIGGGVVLLVLVLLLARAFSGDPGPSAAPPYDPQHPDARRDQPLAGCTAVSGCGSTGAVGGDYSHSSHSHGGDSGGDGGSDSGGGSDGGGGCGGGGGCSS